MAETKFLKQGEGRTVRQENGQPWPAEGMEAEDTLYIRRRIRDEDLVPADRPTEPAPSIEEPAEIAKRGRKPAETEGDAK
ncbi:DUF2635 domain-containing protein [Rhizobium sp. C1]|uniref:DUF2635 domain-containing protein n=1 Tax=Rhizobium sp. C1 TaxID=1349799 RepID=UPI001E50BFAB|nr:DUF2635 domain-containing protein [Rhizobium sp. C1]MCD2176444.1 DUF2635 domain-containing protein [Rhizobium sp. C1]